MTTFPECVEQKYEFCVTMINRDLRKLGLEKLYIVTHKKCNANQDGYYKVVIVTNELVDRVVGRDGDGMVQYPFLWKDKELGKRVIGVDGKWNCLNMTPEACYNAIKESMSPNSVCALSFSQFHSSHLAVPYIIVTRHS